MSTTPAPTTAPDPTRTPSSSELPAPTNASSSTMTGRAPAGSRTPPIVTPADRWTRAPICAHEPTSTWLSSIVSSPIHAPTLTNEGGMITTPGPRWTPARTLVPPGTMRHGRPTARAASASGPSRRRLGGRPARSRNRSAPPRSQVDVSRSRKQARIAAFTAGSVRQPAGAVGSGTAARRVPRVELVEDRGHGRRGAGQPGSSSGAVTPPPHRARRPPRRGRSMVRWASNDPRWSPPRHRPGRRARASGAAS